MTGTGPFTVVASAARTVTGNSGAIQILGVGLAANLQVTVTAVSGTTPSMALAVQWSNDGTNFGPVDGTGDNFAAITTTGTVTKQLQVKGLYMQIVWTLTGTTPSFTFSVSVS